ncbi:hypothetical protein THAR02_06247 [Trichoderma harzianum]|uniref:Uncharacterized protein n=1 Tax=Trichoderma harzianum TaxID=5544 RepID=A0A0F9XN03_TRIHA|nr:hypothetical protein THAR02_06247 [Trichoderma harzianum]
MKRAVGPLDKRKRVSRCQACAKRQIKSLQQRLQKSDAAVSEDVAWSTFLLGLFELMSESSGEGWAKHMFYGTSKVLQLAGPDAYASSLQQKLLNAFRVLEANRTMMFGDTTFLSESKWRVYNSINHEAAAIPDCMASITELMIHTSAFSKRLFEQIESIPEEERLFNPTITALAHEGTELHRKICNCLLSQNIMPFGFSIAETSPIIPVGTP